MKRFTNIFSWALTAALSAGMLASCTDTDLVVDNVAQQGTENAENAIQFSTYVGSSQGTRAGAKGLQTNKTLKENGFGVFAYYTGTQTYGEYQDDWYTDNTGPKTGNKAANFMYNQQVKWDAARETEGGYITNWTYEPVKYWPNEVNDTGTDKNVDDQTEDAPTTYNSYGGYVSFFAYAPYVEYKEYGSDGKKTLDGRAAGTHTQNGGIVQINESNFLNNASDKGNNFKGDPIITYQMPQGKGTLTGTDIDNATSFVDLLWGTLKGTAGKNVIDTSTLGVTSNGTEENPFYATENMYDVNSGTTASGTYSANIKTSMSGSTPIHYTVNADLTKQKTTGTIGFQFKHALSIVGGNYDGSGDDDIINGDWGFRIILDNDDDKGAEDGGKKGKETVVSVKYIKIDAQSYYTDDTGTYYVYPDDGQYCRGKFNLATGRWNINLKKKSASPAKQRRGLGDAGSGETPYTQTQVIGNTTVGSAIDVAEETSTAGETYQETDALNNAILEPASGVTSVTEGTDEETAYLNTETANVGVLNRAQNVYQNPCDPLVFFPGTHPDITIETCYIVRTKDANLAKGYSEVKQVIKKHLTFDDPVEMGKKYNLLMHLGLTDVKFTAEVENWDAGTDDPNYSTDGSLPMDIHVENVYLPKNVGALANSEVMTLAAGGTHTFIAAANTANLTFNLTGLDASKTYTVTIDNSGTVKEVDGTGTAAASVDITPKGTTVSIAATLPSVSTETTFTITVTEKSTPAKKRFASKRKAEEGGEGGEGEEESGEDEEESGEEGEGATSASTTTTIEIVKAASTTSEEGSSEEEGEEEEEAEE